MNWFRKFMTGRYGGDQLSTALLILSLIFILIARLTNISQISLIVYALLFINIFRMFSKDISKRSMENYKFAIFISPLYDKFRKTKKHINDSKTHKFYKCPNCKQKLRLPKGKGKIVVTCTKCKTKFNKKT